MRALNASRVRQVIKCLPVFLFLFLLLPIFSPEAAARGEERIIDFKSKITVNQDSTMRVVETITVESKGVEIQRGIYRDFPTKYRDELGNRYAVGFEVESVLRDGEPEEYSVENMSNGKRVYIGREDYILQPGTYTYIITYSTDSQLGFFENHDELYWNVTGNGWIFPIETASASVTLPKGISPEKISVEGYTGPQGSKAGDLKSSVSPGGVAQFVTTKPLNPEEGLTIVVTWPKGYVTEPTASEKAFKYYRNNSMTITGISGLLILLLYYLLAWLIVGRDPRKETIIPLYNPPVNMSPASMRFMKEMGYDQKAFASTIINMAVKGYLWIDEVNGKYILNRGEKDESVLDNDERAVASALGFNRRRQLELSNKNHSSIRSAIDTLKNSLKSTWEKGYFKNNRGFFWGGFGITAVSILSIFIFDNSGNSFSLLFSSGWSLAVVVLMAQTIKSWRRALRGKNNSEFIAAIILTVFTIPFLLVLIIFSLFSGLTNFITILAIAAMASANIVFFKLLKAHTREGRRIMDKIEGFKMYLSIAEKDKMNLLNPPEKTPELFEKYLPYALALGVEQEWGEQFADVLSTASQEGTYYYPRWYRGTTWDMYHVGSFTDFLGNSFSEVISSSSTPPGSSSGSHGGGSSGGGGGGGGGGGW